MSWSSCSVDPDFKRGAECNVRAVSNASDSSRTFAAETSRRVPFRRRSTTCQSFMICSVLALLDTLQGFRQCVSAAERLRGGEFRSRNSLRLLTHSCTACAISFSAALTRNVQVKVTADAGTWTPTDWLRNQDCKSRHNQARHNASQRASVLTDRETLCETVPYECTLLCGFVTGSTF